MDLIVRKETPYRLEEFRRRRAVVVDGMSVWLVAPEDLILSKLVWMRESGSELQRRDVELLVASVRDLDRKYIERWAVDLRVQDAWREVARAAE